MTSGETDPVSVSIVVPVYSGEAYLGRLVEEIAKLKTQWAEQNAPIMLAEAILVDDSAIDGSPSLIDRIADEYDWVVPLHLSRNYGQHPATAAGILHSVGNWVVTMDEDLQHPPGKIPDLLARAVAESADVVYAKPTAAVHKSAIRDFSSTGIKRLLGWLTGSKHVRMINSFRLIRGEIARSVSSVAIHDTYFDIELGFFTQRIVSEPMDLVDERYVATGKSGYNFRSLISHAQRMIFSSNLRILRFMTLAGAITVGFALLMAAGLAISKLIWPGLVTVRGWSSLMVAILFFSGMNIGLIGVALQYLSTLVLRAHGRPTFFVIDRSRDTHLAAFLGKRPRC
ncbi:MULTISPECIES: glycosyltransferase [unclassified Sphingopyxis]|uniref:glycosyltransferase n=1 Tax=unclassified Sphingopyxis TaxID=2614943 RepID=UPI0024ADF838|nr:MULTISPECIES: glycosyltransferase [unclassified Sphingopyxis]